MKHKVKAVKALDLSSIIVGTETDVSGDTRVGGVYQETSEYSTLQELLNLEHC